MRESRLVERKMTILKLSEDHSLYWQWRFNMRAEVIQHTPFETEPGRLFVEELETANFDELVDDFRCDAVSWSTVVTGRLQRVARDQLESGAAGFGLLRQFLQTMFFSDIAVAAM